MTQKITLVKNYRETETLRVATIDELVQSIVACEYKTEIDNLRNLYPLISLQREADGRMTGANNYTDKIPRVCFASEMVNRNRRRQRLAYNPLVLLEVNNLASYDEADAVRRGCALMPHTLLAFVGASGRSVKIVCRGEVLGDNRAENSVEALGDEELRRFHLNLYEKARLAYNAQLGVTVEHLEPRLDRSCYVSADAQAVYNAQAVPFYVDPADDVQRAVSTVAALSDTDHEEAAPSIDRYYSLRHIFEFNLQKAYDALEDVGDDDELFAQQLLSRLADNCRETGMPMAVAVHMAGYRWPFRDDRDLVRLTFDNAYRRQNEARYLKRKHLLRPEKNVPAEALLTMKINIFLRENYELRKNVMRGVAEFRDRNGLGFDFRDLTDEARNSITMRAMSLGIRCWDKDIRRYVNSDEIELYDPLEDFLDQLPRWDGRDRVTPLARRVHTDYEAWPQLFHVWMRSIVAMWQGKGQLTGNALVPLLIGRQGCGKTSFCRLLMPWELRDYYNDRISFRNEQDLNLGLTSFALINLDEFDKITDRQQVVLKYLVSTADLKYRPPYGKAYQQHRRYASFIATTNEPTPLVDTTGSRRFICVQVEGDIDFNEKIDYQQLYAQLKQEVSNGEPYWLTTAEEAALMEHNRQFQRISGLAEMLHSLYRRPEKGEQGTWLSLRTISERMKWTFRSGYKEDEGSLKKLGSILSRPDYKFESRRRAAGVEYLVVEQG